MIGPVTSSRRSAARWCTRARRGRASDRPLVDRTPGHRSAAGMAARAGHRIRRVVAEAVGRTLPRRGSGRLSLPSPAAVLARAPAVQVVAACSGCPGSGQSSAVAPLLRPSRRSDRRFVGHAVVDAFEPVVEPAQLQLVDRWPPRGPKSTSPDFLLPVQMHPRADDKSWPVRATPMPPAAHADEILDAPFMKTSYQPPKLSAGTVTCW